MVHPLKIGRRMEQDNCVGLQTLKPLQDVVDLIWTRRVPQEETQQYCLDAVVVRKEQHDSAPQDCYGHPHSAGTSHSGLCRGCFLRNGEDPQTNTVVVASPNCLLNHGGQRHGHVLLVHHFGVLGLEVVAEEIVHL